MAVQQVTMEGLIDYLELLLENRFSTQIAEVYFGDIGVYLPSTFGSSRQTQKAVVALSPSYDHPIPGQRVAAYELRNIGVDIIIMVNITPFFSARPQEAFGERMLVRLVSDVTKFLTQEANINLGGRVQWSEVGDVDFAWMAKGDQAIRAAAISFQARVRIPRVQ